MICRFLESFVVVDKLFDDKIVKCLFLLFGWQWKSARTVWNRKTFKGKQMKKKFSMLKTLSAWVKVESFSLGSWCELMMGKFCRIFSSLTKGKKKAGKKMRNQFRRQMSLSVGEMCKGKINEPISRFYKRIMEFQRRSINQNATSFFLVAADKLWTIKKPVKGEKPAIEGSPKNRH